MNSKTLNKFVWLMKLLLQHRYVTYEEMDQAWRETDFCPEGEHLSKRTSQRLLREVEDIFEVEIKCDASQGYAYYIVNLEDFRNNKSHQWLLNSFCTEEMLTEGKSIPDRIIYEDIPEKAEYLSLVIDAMKHNKKMSVSYQTYHEQTPTTYILQPYCIRLYKQHWYVLGLSETHNALRHFAINRMHDLVIMPETFEYPNDFYPENYYLDSVGIYVDKKLRPQHVKLRVYGNEVNYFRALPLHHSQKEVFTGKDYSDFSYNLCETPDLTEEILSKGSKVEVLEPKSLQKKIENELIKMLKYYKK